MRLLTRPATIFILALIAVVLWSIVGWRAWTGAADADPGGDRSDAAGEMRDDEPRQRTGVVGSRSTGSGSNTGGASHTLTFDIAADSDRFEWRVRGADPMALVGFLVGPRGIYTPLPGVRVDVVPNSSYWTLADISGSYRPQPIALPAAAVGMSYTTQMASFDPAMGLPRAANFRTSQVAEMTVPGREVDMVILFGQSNAEGYADRTALPVDLGDPTGLFHARIWQVQPTGSRFAVLTAGVNNTTIGNPAWCGPEMSLLQELTGTRQSRFVYLLKFAVGETTLGPKPGPFNEWAPSAGELYSELLRRLDGAVGALRSRGLDPRVRCAFFMQGESDTLTLSLAQGYESRLRTLLSTLRSDLGGRGLAPGEGMPVVIGQISSGLSAQGPFYVQEVRDAQAAVARADTATELVDTSNLSIQLDGVHFDTAGVIELGRLFAAAAARLGQQ